MLAGSLTRREYEKRLNRVLEFIEAHLHEDIRLDRLAEVACFSPFHFHRIFSALVGEPPAEFVRIPSLRIAYVKHLKGYQDSAGIEGAFRRLFLWAGPRGYLGGEMKVLGMSFDNPDITPQDKCRYYACVQVSPQAAPEGEVGIMETHAGRYAVAGFKGGPEVFKRAYDFMYGRWLPGSGFQPDDFPCYEVYQGEPQGSRKPVFRFDLYIPVKPL